MTAYRNIKPHNWDKKSLQEKMEQAGVSVGKLPSVKEFSDYSKAYSTDYANPKISNNARLNYDLLVIESHYGYIPSHEILLTDFLKKYDFKDRLQ